MLYYCALPIVDKNITLSTLKQTMLNEGYKPNVPEIDSAGHEVYRYIDRFCAGFNTIPVEMRTFDLRFAFKTVCLLTGEYFRLDGFNCDCLGLNSETTLGDITMRNPINRSFIKLLDNDDSLFVAVNDDILKQLHPIDMKMKYNAIPIYCIIVDVLDSNESITVIRSIHSKDRFSINTKVANMLFKSLNKSLYTAFSPDKSWRLKQHIHQFSSWLADSLKFKLSFSAWVDYLRSSLTSYESKSDFYDIFIYNGKEYKYDKTYGLFVNIDNEVIFIETNEEFIESKASLCNIENLEAEVIEPEQTQPIQPAKLPGTCLVKTDNGFFDDAVIEVDVK